ncbi:MAG: Exodeoxyribonuclease III [Gammaproteobacteria bacterium]|nr:Exodeoxyribonuclease III [Gammaproteobacteria bacterium]
MKIATWNVNSLKARLPHLLRWLATARPDIVALQETKTQDAVFPVAEILSAGYEAAFSGQKTYNGVATLSRRQLEIIDRELPAYEDPQRRMLATRHGPLRVVNVYVPNGASLDSDKYRYKLDWLARLRDYMGGLLQAGDPLILLGDFNIAPEDRDVHDPQAWSGQVLVSEPERARFRELEALGLRDCLRAVDSRPGIYSWWDYRAAAYRRNLGLRIDLILADGDSTSRCRNCFVDVAPRKWERPSDHAPVIAELDLPS